MSYNSEYHKQYRKRDYVKQQRYESTKRYRAAHREKVREWARRSVSKARSQGKANGLVWYYRNHERAKRLHRQWSANNRHHIRQYEKIRMSTKAWVKIRNRVAGHIHYALRAHGGGAKVMSTMKLVGCTIEFLMGWIESKWKKGMSWENYGLSGWHIDHITPCAAFDLTKPDQQRQCFHYTNLQPLWWLDNIQKSDKIIPHQPELCMSLLPEIDGQAIKEM